MAADGIFLAIPEEPRAGIRLGVKDLLDTAGLTTTYGSAVFAEHVPPTTAESVHLAESGGYTNVGKTNLHEFAYGVTSENPHFGTVPNPVAPGRIAGGSIRIPAACCGVVGFKPTYGLVSIDGCFPLAPSFDHLGPMARTVEECAALLEVIAPGFAAAELTSLEEIAAGTAWVDEADPLVSRRVHETTAHFPRSQSIAWPRPEIGALFMREVADVHRELYAENGELYGEGIAVKIERCLAVSDAEATQAEQARGGYRERCLELFDGLDLLLTPTLQCVAPPTGVGDLALRERLIANTLPFNTLGWPALALPCGPAEDGLPASVQLVGRPGADALVLAAGGRLASLIQGTAERGRLPTTT